MEKVYVTNSYANTVAVIDTATDSVVTMIDTGTAPVNPTLSPDHRQIYLANVEDATISVIDIDTDTIVRTIPAGTDKPSGLAFTPDGKRLVITFLGEATDANGFVGVMQLATGELSPLIELQAQPERIALTPDGRFAYIPNLCADSLSVVDLAAAQVVATIPMGTYPFNLLMAPDGKRVYVGHVKGETVVAIDTALNSIAQTYDVASGPNGMAFSRDFKRIYITNVFADKFQVLDLTTNHIVSADAGEKPGNLALTKDGLRGYFVRPFGTHVAAIDLKSLKVSADIDVGSGPSTLIVATTSDHA